MGALFVCRLTNDRNYEVVGYAFGEIGRSSVLCLPSPKQSEVALIGVDLPITMTVQIGAPVKLPKSDSAKFQEIWSMER